MSDRGGYDIHLDDSGSGSSTATSTGTSTTSRTSSSSSSTARLLIDVEGRGTVTLGRHQGYTVPRAVVHRTRAPRRTVILMVEPAGVQPTGD